MAEDVSLFSELVSTMKIEDQQEIALSQHLLSENMLALYDGIEEYIKQNHLENEVSDVFKTRYIELLLKFQKKRVLGELMNSKYPLKDCLSLCEQAKQELAIAYLKNRLGDIQEALEIYKKRYNQFTRLARFIHFFTLNKKSQDLKPYHRAKIVDKIDDILDLALEICKDKDSTTNVKTSLYRSASNGLIHWPRSLAQTFSQIKQKISKKT